MGGFGKRGILWWIGVGFGLWAAVGLIGCGGPTLCPVQGRIMYTDGTPAKELAGYTVTFESVDQAATADKPGISGWGEVKSDGTFQISTYRPGDGAVPGRHRVAINPPPSLSDEPPTPPVIPLKYASFETSGLEVQIAPGPNDVTLTVQRNLPEKQPAAKKKM
jgi:hypothetical protein